MNGEITKNLPLRCYRTLNCYANFSNVSGASGGLFVLLGAGLRRRDLPALPPFMLSLLQPFWFSLYFTPGAAFFAESR